MKIKTIRATKIYFEDLLEERDMTLLLRQEAVGVTDKPHQRAWSASIEGMELVLPRSAGDRAEYPGYGATVDAAIRSLLVALNKYRRIKPVNTGTTADQNQTHTPIPDAVLVRDWHALIRQVNQSLYPPANPAQVGPARSPSDGPVGR